METYYEPLPGLISRSSLALGFFDGVHPGHQLVIDTAIAQARKLGVPAGVVTFRDHPRTLTQGNSPFLLTVIEQRLAHFERLGVDFALVLAFTEALCRLSPEEYVESILVKTLGAKSITVGYNHHFGKDREGSPALLTALGKRLGFGVTICPPVIVEDQEVSSSKIRDYLANGQVETANHLLSYPYTVAGDVVKGDGRGKQLGFPTANLATEEFQVIPAGGVYAGTLKIDSNTVANSVINIGYRPTFQENSAIINPQKPIVEAHMLDHSCDLYGRRIQVSFDKYLRAEKKFASVDQLRAQIASDCERARSVLANKYNQSVPKPHQKLPA